MVGATVRRFRPIVLTAAAAVLALIPLVRSDFFGPMAVAMMGGIVVATVLTLVFLPALYAAWFRVRRGAGRRCRRDARVPDMNVLVIGGTRGIGRAGGRGGVSRPATRSPCWRATRAGFR